MLLLALLACVDRSTPAADTGDSGSTDTDTGTRDTAATADSTDTTDTAAATDTADTAIEDTAEDPDTGALDLSASADGWWTGESVELGISSGRFVGDLDLDGTDDVALLTTVARDPDWVTAFWYVPGGQPVAPEMTAAATASADWRYGYPAWPRVAFPAGDMDGDGWPDLWIGGGGELASVALLLGPPTDWTPGGTLADADLGFASGSDDAATELDIDDDGLTDAVWFGHDDATGSDGGVFVIHGGSATLAVDLTVRCDAPYGFAVGDVTGDGAHDFVVSFSNDVRLVDGADLPREGVLASEDVVGTTITGGTGHDLAVVGDWTGDGIDDWVMAGGSGTFDHPREGVLRVFAGDATAARAGDLDADTTAAGSFLGGHDDARLGGGGVRSLPARDGGDALDAVTSLTVDGDADALVLPAGSMAGGYAPLPTGALRISGAGGAVEHVGNGVTSVGDFDGDGILDLLAGAGWWEEGRGRVFLDLGW